MQLTPAAALVKYDDPAPCSTSSAVRQVIIIGHHGPFKAAFTAKELRELITLDAHPPPATPTAAASLDFFRSPMALITVPDRYRLTPMLSHTALDTSARAIGVTSVQHADLVVATLRHHADPVAAYVDPVLGHLRTRRGGRVLDGAGRALRHGTITLAMRVKRLASGTRGMGLLRDGAVDLEGVLEVEVEVWARLVMQYDQWKKIDAEEVQRSAEMDKERERMG
ncbi:hypothetical protein BJY52DRAFT_1229564 [Lactarius psammicola]|nr:hypothetical protein BJY52DRAFT_1229564 [Lactarius psammicola]